MEQKEDFIKGVINGVLKNLISGVPIEQRQELLANYSSMLSERYDSLIKRGVYSRFPFSEFVQRIINSELLFLADMPLLQKQQIYLKDENLDELAEVSKIAQRMAIGFYEEGKIISLEQREDINAKMNEILKRVRPFNKMIAANLLSEGTVDLMYASGKTDITSFRINDYIRSKLNPKSPPQKG